MKAPKVNSIDETSVKIQIKKCPIDVQQYISALERALESQKDVTNKAIKKIRELSKEPEKEYPRAKPIVKPMKKEDCPTKHSGAYKDTVGIIYCPDCENYLTPPKQ